MMILRIARVLHCFDAKDDRRVRISVPRSDGEDDVVVDDDGVTRVVAS